MKEKGLKFKDKKTRYPYGIFVVSIFLILTSLAQSTLTITDSSITDSTNGILIDITNDYISFNNASFTSNISIGGSTITSSNITGWDSITGDGDFETTKIMNSNGNSWAVTESNLALALADVGDSGTVWVGDDLTLTSNISFDNSFCTLDFMDNNVTLSGDIEFIYVTDSIHSTIQNVKIITDIQTGAIFDIHGADWSSRVDYLTVDNVYISNNGGTDTYAPYGIWYYVEHNYTGFWLHANNDGGQLGRVDTCIFKNIVMDGAGIGVHLDVYGAGYVNGNQFQNVYIDQFVTAIEFETHSTGRASHNIFTNVKTQTGYISEYGIKDVSGNANTFNDVLMWDWNTGTVNPNGERAYWIGSNSYGTKLELHEYAPATWSSQHLMYDYGSGTMIDTGFGHVYDNSEYDYIIYRNSTHTFLQNGASGIIEFSDTDDRDVFYELINVVDAGADSVFICAGTYEFDSGLANVNFDDFTFIGESKYTTIIKPESGTTLTTGLISTYQRENITFKNIQFSGEDATGQVIGVYLGSDSQDILVENCIFTNFDTGATSYGIYSVVYGGSHNENLKIINCDFWNSNNGINLDGGSTAFMRNCTITNNYFDGCTDSIEADYIMDSLIVDNVIRDTTDAIDINSGTDNIIKDNIGHTASSFHSTPVSASNPYDTVFDGATYLISGNQTLAIYYSGSWYYYTHT